MKLTKYCKSSIPQFFKNLKQINNKIQYITVARKYWGGGIKCCEVFALWPKRQKILWGRCKWIIIDTYWPYFIFERHFDTFCRIYIILKCIKTNHMLGQKSSFNKFQRAKIIQSIVFDRSQMKLKISTKKITFKHSPDIWKLTYS